eukprot:PhM_4_TR5188/c0_g1_i5/m.99177/K03327/TC.MATE, SLC47A, norM, mdtK, dinF; multidrug resistance protein, MATE family
MSWEQSILLPLTERNARRRKVVGHVSCPHYYIRCIVRVAVDPVSALRWATRHRGAGGRCARRHVLQHVGGMQHRWPRLCAGHTPPTGVRRRQAQPAHVSVHAARGLSVHDVWFRCRCDLVQHRDYPRPPPPGPERGGGRGCLRPHLHPVPCARHCLRSRAQATAGRRGDDAVVRRLRRRRTDHARRLPTVHPHDGDGRPRCGACAVSGVVHEPAVGGGHRLAQGRAPRAVARLLPRGAQYLALGIPCLLMLLLEWGSFEAAGIVAGVLGVQELGVMVVSTQVDGVCFVIMLGLGTAVAVRVGDALGANDVATAKRTFMTSMFVTAVALLCNVTLLYVLRHAVADFFTKDVAVHRSFIALVPYLMLFHLFDGLQCICNSLVRGMGFQRWGLLFNCVTYGLGVPIA